MRSTHSLPSLPGPLSRRVVAPDRVLSMVQIELNCVLTLNCIAWNRTVLTFKQRPYTKLNYFKWSCFCSWTELFEKQLFWHITVCKQNNHHHHHHHGVPLARISLTLFRHFSRSFIASGRSSGLHPVSSHSCCMYIRARIVLNITFYSYENGVAIKQLTKVICHITQTNKNWNFILIFIYSFYFWRKKILVFRNIFE